jgi:hypothetical protein
MAQELFQNYTLAGKNSKYWCEKGRYKEWNILDFF